MTIPIPVIMAALSVVQAEASARSKRQEAAEQAVVRQAEIELERERITAEIAAADRRADREKEVITRMLDAAVSIHEMKTEAIVGMFRDAKSLLEGHQRILAEEKSAMNRQLTETEVSPQRHVLIMKRQQEVDRELALIDEEMTSLTERCVEVIACLRPEMEPLQIKQSVNQALIQAV